MNNDFVKNEDGKVKDFMVFLEGKERSFRCDCGCNIFHKPINDDAVYICNSCDMRFRGE